jgi:hypothetical protein
MANVTAAGTVWNCPNYVGELFLVGAGRTPFLNMIGGLTGGGRTASAFAFATAQPWSLEAAAQPAISESASLTAPDPVTYVRGQDVNTCQIFQKQVSVSYAKQSSTGLVAGLSLAGEVQPVGSERDFQIMAAMRQVALDVDWCFLNGAYQAAADAATPAKTRGIVTACTTNVEDATGAALDKDHIETLLREMADNGAQFGQMVLFCSAFQKQKLSSLYGYAPTDRTVGGLAVQQLVTDFAQIGVVWAPNVPAGTVLVADLAVCAPVFLPVPGKGVLFYEELSKTGAAEKGQIYGQIGLDYGPEEYHGKIVNLATT